MNKHGDLPGRRSRARTPVPLMRVSCECGRNLFDVTDTRDRAHPRWDSAGELVITWHRPPDGGRFTAQQPDGLITETHVITCRCGRRHEFRTDTVARAWQANMTGAAGTVRITAGEL